MAIKLKMVRRGSFRANWSTHENMCGIALSSNPTYNYVCEIECGTVLDKHGFMIDQLDVDSFFQTRYTYSMRKPDGHKARSCEVMAIECCEDVKYMVESHMMKATGNSEIHRIAVTIFFNETAAMTAEWKASDEKFCNTLSSGTASRKPGRKTNGRQRGVGKTDSVPRSTAGRHEGIVEEQPRRSALIKRILSGNELGGAFKSFKEPTDEQWDGY